VRCGLQSTVSTTVAQLTNWLGFAETEESTDRCLVWADVKATFLCLRKIFLEANDCGGVRCSSSRSLDDEPQHEQAVPRQGHNE
jgi:hypothetical protein